MSARARMHRFRNRRRDGRIVLRIEVDEVDVTETLIASNFLHPEKAEDRHEIEAALERVIRGLAAADIKRYA